MITIEDLKKRWFNAYPEVIGISGDQHIQCYGKKDVDECLSGIEAVPEHGLVKGRAVHKTPPNQESLEY